MNVNSSLIRITFIICVIWFILPITYLIHFTSDDSYFYFKTAQNFAIGKGSSFDGINSTNGYHPLWFLCLALYYLLINLFLELTPDLLLRFTFILVTCINSVSIYFLIKLIKKTKIFESKYSLYGLILFTIPFTFFYVIGFENNLLVTLIILYLYYDYELKNDQTLSIKVFILCLLFLTRIDFSLIISTVLLYNEKKNLGTKSFIWIIFSMTAVIISYLLLNKIYFGSFTSISLRYKFNFDISENLRLFPTPLSNPIDFSSMIFIIFSGVQYFSYKFIKRINIEEIKPFVLLYIVSLLFLGINYLFNKKGAREWYYIFPVFISSILLLFTLDKQKLSKAFFYLMIPITLIYFTLFRLNYYNHDSAYNFSKSLKKIIKDNEIIYQIDYSGLISFFSERTVINGDGLINSHDYYNILKNNKLKDYLKRLNPDYFIFYNFERNNQNQYLLYHFSSFHQYTFSFPESKVKLKYPLIYGGIFRKKYGYFYLVDTKDFFTNCF